jgi:hypothetical protein
MPEVRVSIPRNVKRQTPFPAALFTSEPLLLTLELQVDGVPTPFTLEVDEEVIVSDPPQQIDVDGALEVTIRDWGAANVGAKLKLVALPQHSSKPGTVIV